MTERELLELAAKAAGIRLEWDGPPDKWQPMYYKGKTYHSWDPLNDDGDALRLAVKLGIEITIGHWENRTIAASQNTFMQQFGLEWPQTVRVHESLLETPEAATRRAIVRCAAEIGKAMA